MKYKVLLPSDGREAILGRLAGSPGDATPKVKVLGSGELLDESAVAGMTSNLGKIRTELTADEAHVTSKRVGQEFDRRACIAIHKALPAEPEVVGNSDFWTWLAVVHLADLIIWRFPSGKTTDDEEAETRDPPLLANFGVGQNTRSRRENFAYKLWLRADLAYDDQGTDENERYRFAGRGDVDFWTSHVHRQGYSMYRDLVRALIRFQYPDELAGKPLLHPGQEDARKGIRTLAKNLKRLQANVELSLLTPSDHLSLIKEQATGLTLHASGQPYTP